ncbi:glutaredoxin family protein [Epidermidibacterium keratini]|uniref:Glutaredoxin family protein n=2 Tax=Epidermidibacterium keratini TaxID=1891644 RepID=A0A7L4YLP3_9ACTN|nr:glutaredoxin family protein [Epidermidibacterium keratini]QHB99792.1 glutaredoxin family protein [Epidermidibacterium keratini]
MEVQVTLMSRDGCHLCEVARSELERILPDYGLRATVVDVDADDELRFEYGDRVPVVLLDGKEHGYFTVEEKRLRAALDARR